MSNASASGAALWGEAVTAGLEDISGTDDTGTAGKGSPGLSPNEQKPLSGTARKLGSIVIYTRIMRFWSGEEHSNQDQNGFADCRASHNLFPYQHLKAIAPFGTSPFFPPLPF